MSHIDELLEKLPVRLQVFVQEVKSRLSFNIEGKDRDLNVHRCTFFSSSSFTPGEWLIYTTQDNAQVTGIRGKTGKAGFEMKFDDQNFSVRTRDPQLSLLSVVPELEETLVDIIDSYPWTKDERARFQFSDVQELVVKGSDLQLRLINGERVTYPVQLPIVDPQTHKKAPMITWNAQEHSISPNGFGLNN